MATQIVGIREHPELLEEGIDYFSAKWNVPRAIYQQSLTDCTITDGSLPRWYLMREGARTLGCFGLIWNDFIRRTDLFPWLCALFVEPSHRGLGLGGRLLDHGRRQAGELGFDKVYLITDHVGYYERYGWRFAGLEEEADGGRGRAYTANAIR